MSQILNEGLGDFFKRIGEFFTNGKPKIEGVRAPMREYYSDCERCRRLFPPLKNSSVTVNVPKGMSDKYKLPEGVTYKDYQENPKYTICLLESQLDYAKKILKFLENTKPEVICQYNISKERCYRWVKTNIPYLKNLLREAKLDLERLKKHGEHTTNTNQIHVFKSLTEVLEKIYKEEK